MASCSLRSGCASSKLQARHHPRQLLLPCSTSRPSDAPLQFRAPASPSHRPGTGARGRGTPASHVCRVFPFDQAWAPDINAASVAPQLFAASLFPYIAFLYFLTRSGKAPKLTVIGFYFLLVFVGATIPAGIYAKSQYGTSLANVDWLHGAAESLLTVTNLMIVLGLRQGIREAEQQKQQRQDEEDAKQAAAGGAAQELQGVGAKE